MLHWPHLFPTSILLFKPVPCRPINVHTDAGFTTQLSYDYSRRRSPQPYESWESHGYRDCMRTRAVNKLQVHCCRTFPWPTKAVELLSRSATSENPLRSPSHTPRTGLLCTDRSRVDPIATLGHTRYLFGIFFAHLTAICFPCLVTLTSRGNTPYKYGNIVILSRPTIILPDPVINPQDTKKDTSCAITN